MPFLTQGKTNWKYILIMAILAILAGGGVLIYTWDFIQEMTLLTKFPEIKKPEKVIEDEIANWKTYRNEKYKFELKYFTDEELNEEDWEEVRLSGDPNLLFQAFFYDSNMGVYEVYEGPSGISSVPVIDLGIFECVEKNIDECVNQIHSSYYYTYWQPIEIGPNIKFNNFSAKEIKMYQNHWRTMKGIVIFRERQFQNDLLYVILVLTFSPDAAEVTKFVPEEVYSQMLSTFRFLE